MEYSRINWKEVPDTTTPINAENLNHMDEGIANAAAELDSQSEALEAVGEAIEDINSDIESMKLNETAENILSTPYYNASRTVAGIEWTVNEDGTIVANSVDGRPATGRSDFYLKNRTASNFFLEPGEYILSGCPEGGSLNKYFMWGSTNTGNIFNSDFGEGRVQVITTDMEGVGIYCSIAAGFVANNIVFKPMLEKGSIKHEWQPYALSREGLKVNHYKSGNYIVEKFADGYMRMVLKKDVVVNITGTNNGICWGELSLDNFPENFREKPAVTYSVMSNGNNAWGWGKSAPTIQNPGQMYVGHGTAVANAALTIVVVAEGY